MARILGFSNDGSTAFVEMRMDVPVSDLRYIELNPPQPIFCSFCAKTNQEVAQMIAGPKGYICNECVPLCEKILAKSKPAGQPKENKRTVSKKRRTKRS